MRFVRQAPASFWCCRCTRRPGHRHIRSFSRPLLARAGIETAFGTTITLMCSFCSTAAPGPQAVIYGNLNFEQVWFPGVHADIGGGYLENEARLWH